MRFLSVLTGLLIALGSQAIGPATAAPLAMVEVAPGIYVHAGVQEDATAANEDAIANIGFIVGDAAVMVVDPGGSAVEGRSLRAAVQAITDKPIRYVVLTHVHPDHIFGAAAFADDHPVFVGHARLPGAMAERGAYYRRALERSLGDKAASSEVIVPTMLVSAMLALDLGDRVIDIEAHRPAHTDNDLTLFDHRTRTLWASDLLFVERIPVIDGSLVGWLQTLQSLRAVPALRAIPGHGPPVVAWPSGAAAEARYLDAVLAGTRAAIRQGVDIGDAWRHVALEERGLWGLFDDYHGRNVTTAYKELEWE
jgi:quinoprotein relay system zinc metallohydrolase 2